MRIIGQGGRLTIGGRLVATLERYSIEYTPEAAHIEAAASDINTFWLGTGGPFTAEFAIGAERMRWREAQATGGDGRLHIRVTGRPDVG